jgi:hypothetical protein
MSVNTLKIENDKLYGTIKWTDVVKITFDGLHKEDLSLVFEYEFANDRVFDENTILEEPSHRIYITKGVTRKKFVQALVEIFAAAFAKCESR